MVTALLAVRVFGDRLVLAEWAAVVAVCVGLALLTAAAGEAGDERATTTLNVALALGVIAIAAGAAVATRSTSVLATTLLSMFAGLGFATTAISARLLPDLSVLSLLSAPATYVLGAAGALAFLTYSVALQRGAVTAATAPMIVMQTVVPALLGIAVLGDMVRSGWLIGAGFGFVATVAGAVTLPAMRASGGATLGRRRFLQHRSLTAAVPLRRGVSSWEAERRQRAPTRRTL
jgi:drug/metabolite transporter (DMT)-like permease